MAAAQEIVYILTFLVNFHFTNQEGKFDGSLNGENIHSLTKRFFISKFHFQE